MIHKQLGLIAIKPVYCKMTSDSGVLQYEYCSVCKYNYEVKKEIHVYTKRHRESVSQLNDKYLAKINQAKTSMSKPDVKNANYEQGVKTWCYFCACEVPRHATLQSRTVCHLGFLSHLKSTSHLKKTKHFFGTNRINRGSMNQYIVQQDVFDRFLVDALKMVNDVDATEHLDHQNEVGRIVASEKLRQQALVEPLVMAETLAIANDTSGHSVSSPADSQEEIKQNIFTGMTPPWLQPDEESSTSKHIGPDMSTYQKHLDLVKKAKLPANRVGKNFNRNQTSEDWLPSFRQVWNNGRRSMTKNDSYKPNRTRGGPFRPGRGTTRKIYNMKKYMLQE